MKKNALVGLLVFSIIFGCGAVAVLAEEGRSLSFEDAIALMEEHNTNLKVAELNLRIAELDYQKAMASNLMTSSQYNKLQAEYNLQRAQNAFKTTRNSNYIDLLGKYNDVLVAERNLQVRLVETQVAEHSYQVVQQKVEIGDAGRLDHLRQLSYLEAAKRNEEAARQTLIERIRVLGNAIGVQERNLELISEFEKPDFGLSLEESIQTALENSFDIWERGYNLKLQEMQLQKDKIDGIPPIDLQRSELELEITRLNLASEEENLVEQITSSFHALEQNRARYDGAVRDYEIAEESFGISKQQADAGLITDAQLLDSRLSLIRDENSTKESLFTYLNSYLQFHQLLGLDGEVK